MKIYILTDLEGVGGVCLTQHVEAGGALYQEARHLLTQEVNAAVQGAIEGGATEILVRDGHGANGGYNLIFDDLHDGALYMMGSPTDSYLSELDDSFDAMFQLGMHPMAGTMHGVLEHTQSSAAWEEMRANGRPMSEMSFCAAIAGEMGVPCVLVTGDQAVCDEAREVLGPEVELVVTKVGLSRHCAIMKPAAVVREMIREGAHAAMGKVGKVTPLDIGKPVEIAVRFKHVYMADGHKCAGKRRLDSRTIAVTGNTAREAFDNLA
ncbi:MAG: M55 family metallopeptidase [Armatimonadota bacterium]|nr:MAG: M55 family metallopeptidase [Armatimonadota bacterium]